MGLGCSKVPVEQVEREGAKVVDVAIGTYGEKNDGIAINMTYSYLNGQPQWDFMEWIKRAAGFSSPSTVNFLANKDGQRPDWNRLRIPPDECQLAKVVALVAVRRLREAFESGEADKLFEVTFEVAAL